MHKVWLAICEEAKVKDLHIQDFRSFAASEGLAQGIDFRVVSKVLGHASTRTTERHYAKPRKGLVAEATKTISSKLSEFIK